MYAFVRRYRMGRDTVEALIGRVEGHRRRAGWAATDIRPSLAGFEVEGLDTFTGPVMISKEAK